MVLGELDAPGSAPVRCGHFPRAQVYRTLVVVRVGIRELRENLRSYLEQVKNGDEVLVTERGRPVARILEPESHEATRARLIREGRIKPATEQKWTPIDVDRLPDLGPGPTLSEIVIAMRRGVEF